MLSTGLSDADPWVRYFACQALGKIGCNSTVEAIAARLKDEAGLVRIAALEALAQLGSEAAWTLLRGAADAEDPDVRRAALVGLAAFLGHQCSQRSRIGFGEDYLQHAKLSHAPHRRRDRPTAKREDHH